MDPLSSCWSLTLDVHNPDESRAWQQIYLIRYWHGTIQLSKSTCEDQLTLLLKCVVHFAKLTWILSSRYKMSTQQLLWLTDVPEAHLQLLEYSQTDKECPGGQSSCSEKTVYSTVYMTLYIHIITGGYGLCTCIWHHLQFGRIRDLKLVSSVKTLLYALVFPEAFYSTLTLFRDLCHLLSINHQQICYVLQVQGSTNGQL